MDEYSTPIEHIRSDMQPAESQPPLNYSDMLQSMETQKYSNNFINESQQQNNQEYPPHPVVQSRIQNNMNRNPNFVQQDTTKIVHNNDNNMNQMQKDIMYILVPSILLYSSPIQNHLMKLVPSLFKDEKPSIIGNIVNGAIIAIIFTALKNMKINFS